jgi:hypothetical protein
MNQLLDSGEGCSHLNLQERNSPKGCKLSKPASHPSFDNRGEYSLHLNCLPGLQHPARNNERSRMQVATVLLIEIKTGSPMWKDPKPSGET